MFAFIEEKSRFLIFRSLFLLTKQSPPANYCHVRIVFRLALERAHFGDPGCPGTCRTLFMGRASHEVAQELGTSSAPFIAALASAADAREVGDARCSLHHQWRRLA